MGKFEDTLTEEQKNLVLGTATDEDGNREDITAGRFLDMMDEYITATMQGDDNRIKGMELMHVILQSLVSLYESRPEMMESENARGTYYITKSLLPIFDSGNFAKWAPYLGFMLTAGADLASELKHPEYKGRDIIQLFEEAERDENGEPTEDSLFFRALANALQAKQTKEEADEVNALPMLSSIIPANHVIPNNRLANEIKNIIDGGLYGLTVSRKGKKKEKVITKCIVSYEGPDVELLSKYPYTEYDRQVMNAVISLYEYGDPQHNITPAMVYRAMIHATETETPSKKQLEAVERSLNKSRFINVKIDCSDELKQRKLSLDGEQITGGKFDTYLLELDRIEVTAGGRTVSAYHITKKPILYEYAGLIGQVITVPAELLEIRNEGGYKLPNTDRRIAVKGYLLRRIGEMKGKNSTKLSNHILYSTIYNEACNEDPTDEETTLTTKEKRLIRAYVAEVLQYWTRKKYIKEYTELKQGRRLIGVKIEF